MVDIPKLIQHSFKKGDSVTVRVSTEGDGKWDRGTVVDWDDSNFKDSPLKNNPCVVPVKFSRGKDKNADMYLAIPYWGANIHK